MRLSIIYCFDHKRVCFIIIGVFRISTFIDGLRSNRPGRCAQKIMQLARAYGVEKIESNMRAQRFQTEFGRNKREASRHKTHTAQTLIQLVVIVSYILYA